MQDKLRLENLDRHIKYVKQDSKDQNKVEWGSVEDEELEQDWCIHHNLSLSALHAVAETGTVSRSDEHLLVNLSADSVVVTVVECLFCVW
jgi:hypothetical protein